MSTAAKALHQRMVDALADDMHDFPDNPHVQRLAKTAIAIMPTLSPEARVTIRNALDWSRTTAPGDGLAIAKYVAEAIAELDALP